MANEGSSVGDARQLRDMFGRFATGVAIVTAKHQGETIGATVSSFISVSLSPPLVSFSIARSAKAIDAWLQVGAFAVSILTEAQSTLSTRFAKSLGDKWSGVECEGGIAVDAPLIRGALAWIECERYSHHDGGDHVIILGRVVAVAKNADGAVRPLIFFGGAYQTLSSHSVGGRVPDEAMWLHGW